jgi:threonine/homoserine/homoserine lactone efflux protein
VSLGEVVGQSLAYAVGIAVSPVPIAALLLMLVTKKARINAPLFLLGWILGLGIVGVIVLLIPGLEATQGEPSTAAGILKGALGVLLLFVGIQAWRTRPKTGEVAEAPKWMERIEEFGGGAALGIGIALSGANPKNLLLAVGGAATISGAGLSSSEQYVALGIFVSIASLSIIVPVVVYFILGPRAETAMTSAKEWLIQNNKTVMSVLILLLSVSLIGDAVEILF